MTRHALFPVPFVVAFLACGAEPPPQPTAPIASATAAPPPVASNVAPPPLASASASPAKPAADDQFAKVEIVAQRVAGNVFMLKGAGGNIGALVGDDGIVIVDDQFAPLAEKIRAALKAISDKPVKFVLNTHFHGDHTGGNAALSSEASIVAHENVRKRLIDGRAPMTIGSRTIPATPPAEPAALPIVTFGDRVAIHVNGEDIRAIHHPHGHTDGDVVVFFVKANVVHMGDDFVTYGFPLVDVGGGGTVRGIIAAMDNVVATLPADVKVIPGHGEVSTLDDVKKLSARLKDIVKVVESEVKKKHTLEQMKSAKVLSGFDDMGKGFISADVFLETVFKELTEKRETKPAGKKPLSESSTLALPKPRNPHRQPFSPKGRRELREARSPRSATSTPPPSET